MKGENSLMTKELVKSEELSDEDRHRFLAYLMPQLEPLRQACEHNWLTQTGLIALAGFYLYNSTPGGGFTIVIFGMTLGTIPSRSLDFVFPMVLTYLVIRLGYLLNAYIFIRTGITNALKKFTNRPTEFKDEKAERMLRANSLVELFCLDYKWPKVDSKWARAKAMLYSAALLILPLMLSAIFALNHILAMLYLGRIASYARGWAITLGIVLGLAMTSCYLHFIFTTEKRGAQFISVATIVFSGVGYMLIHKFAYGSYW